MFHPLLDSLSGVSDQELDKKLSDLYKRYSNMSLVGNPDVRRQLSLMIDSYRSEMMRRTQDRQNKQDGPDPFASVDIQ
jgi:hypothetical protein